MKLLLDQNLSPRLIGKLSDLYPNSAHVDNLGLGLASDKAVWDYARANDYVIVSKNSDFNDLNLLWGFPPKVVWVRRGNCSSQEIELLLRTNYSAIESLYNNVSVGLLTLF